MAQLTEERRSRCCLVVDSFAVNLHHRTVSAGFGGDEKKRKEGLTVQGSCHFCFHPSPSPLLLTIGWLFLQLLRRAEGLVDVGCELLHLVVQQQVLKEQETERCFNHHTQEKTDIYYNL